MSTRPVFLDGVQERAACGQSMQVVLPMPFDDDDPDACAQCAREVSHWSCEPATWWERRQHRDATRRLREEEDEDIAYWRGRQQ